MHANKDDPGPIAAGKKEHTTPETRLNHNSAGIMTLFKPLPLIGAFYLGHLFSKHYPLGSIGETESVW
jgi:hypothetical protein